MSVAGIALGPFVLEDPLGQGGMGQVWRGRHETEGLAVAVKVVTAARAREARYRRAFRNEVESVARLDHPGIVRVLEAGEIDEAVSEASSGRLAAGCPYLVMEHLSGGQLRRDTMRPDWLALRGVLLELLDALAYAHARGVVHRDLKPSNVVLGTSADMRPGLKVIDFGLAAVGRAWTVSGGEEELSGGTPRYMAPEQAVRSPRDQGPWTDLYSLGCLAYALASGEPPFRGERLDVLEAQLTHELPRLVPRVPVPDGFEGWLRRLTAKAPSARFTFAADAAHTLLELGPRPKRRRPSEPPMLEPPARVTRPRLPADWRRPVEDAPAPRLAGTGLGLYGLRPVPIVDREVERTALWDALHLVAETGAARAVVLRGPSGTGKSRLAEWVCERAHETGGATVLRVFHGPTAARWEGLTAAVAMQLGCADLGHAAARERLSVLLPDDEDLAGALAGVLCPDERSSSFGGPEERYTVLLRWLARQARERPVVLWLDDVHWGSDAIAFADIALGRQDAEPTPLLFVLTAREEGLAEQPIEAAQLEELSAREGASEIAVGALDRGSHAALVRRLLGLAEDLAAAVEERTSGNPLFAVHLVGEWVRGGALVRTGRGFALSPGHDAALPDDLHRFWAARIADLRAGRPAGDGVALEIAAALGQDVDADEWQASCAEAGCVPSADLLDALVVRRLARSTEHGWSFVHGMVRESVERLARDAGRWRDHHRVCAAVLAERGGPFSAERRGRHLFAAGDFDGAADSLLAGARARSAVSDLRGAMQLADLREDALGRSGASEKDARWGEGWVVRASIHRALGQYRDVRRWSWRALAAARTHGWQRVLPAAMHSLGTAEQQRGRLWRVEVLNERALVLLQALGDDEGVGDCLWALGWAARQRGDVDRAEACYRSALEIAERLGLVKDQGDCMRGLAQVALRRGDLAEAARLDREAIGLYEEAGHRMGVVYAENGAGEAARFAGDLAAAERHYRRALTLAEAIGSTEAVFPRMNLAFALLARGRYVEARPALEAARRVFERTGRRAYLLGAEVGLLTCAAALGDLRAFDERLRSAEQLFEETRFVDRDTALAAERAGDLAREAGEEERARAAHRIAAAQWRGLGKGGV